MLGARGEPSHPPVVGQNSIARLDEELARSDVGAMSLLLPLLGALRMIPEPTTKAVAVPARAPPQRPAARAWPSLAVLSKALITTPCYDLRKTSWRDLRRSYLVVLIASGVMLLLTKALLWGPLFPWSPVKPGYELLRLVRADVYFGAGSSLDPAYARVDEAIEITERFHQLNLRHRMTIIVCRDWADFHRFLPIVPGDGMGAATPEYGTVIFVTPKVQQMNFDISEFIRHELSHAVIDQSSNLWKSLQFKNAPWLFEGVAVLAARQNAYGTWDDFLTRVRKESLGPLFLRESWK